MRRRATGAVCAFGSREESQESRLARRYRLPLVDCVNSIGLTGHTSLKVSTLRLQYSAAIWSGRAAGHRSARCCDTPVTFRSPLKEQEFRFYRYQHGDKVLVLEISEFPESSPQVQPGP